LKAKKEMVFNSPEKQRFWQGVMFLRGKEIKEFEFGKREKNTSSGVEDMQLFLTKKIKLPLLKLPEEAIYPGEEG